MTRDDIIRMAREAGFTDASFCRWSAYTDDLERFAALVAAAEREKCYELIETLIAAEREACAKVADEVGDDDEDCHAWTAADVIRARGEE